MRCSPQTAWEASGRASRSHTTLRLGDRWLQEQHAWSIQNQVSLPFLLRSNEDPKLVFGTFAAHEYDNPWLIWNDHASNA